MKKWIKKYTTWKIGDYILQLSVVILGIIVTFAGGNLLEERAKAKELAKAMQIVKSELELNRQEVARIKDILKLEKDVARYLLRYENRIAEANADTLQMYLHTLFFSQLFTYTSDALEMLKASSLVQQIHDKELVLQVVRAYSKLKSTDEIFKWYYSIKEKEGDFLNQNSVYVKRNKTFMEEGNVYKIWKHRLENIHVHNILRTAAYGGGFEENFQETQNALTHAIEIIDKEYGLK